MPYIYYYVISAIVYSTISVLHICIIIYTDQRLMCTVHNFIIIIIPVVCPKLRGVQVHDMPQTLFTVYKPQFGSDSTSP